MVRVSAAKAIAALSQGETASVESVAALVAGMVLSPMEHNFVHGSIKTVSQIN